LLILRESFSRALGAVEDDMENLKQSPSRTAPNQRRMWTRAEAEGVLDEWAKSGKSLTAFARSQGIVPQRLAWWRKRLAFALHRPTETTAAANNEPATFIPVTVRSVQARPVAPETMAAVDLGGIRVELRTLDSASAAWVAQLVHALEASS
jgi:hypothetical protein